MSTNEAAVVYPGKDLEAMSFAVKYHRWMLDEFRPFIGKDIVEVGAGSGSFSEMLLDTSPERLSLVEPSEMFESLKLILAKEVDRTDIQCFNAIFCNAAAEIVSSGKPDTIIYVNVLEHIEDDVAELKLIMESLQPGGHALIFVPAMPSLMSDFDRAIGHFRRYRKTELERKAGDAGFEIVKSKYFDVAGIAPWLVKYRMLRSKTMSGGAVSAYDNLVVPFMRRVESIIAPPIGKNILLVARKKA
jgi:SAM-dependent methyltransferase